MTINETNERKVGLIDLPCNNAALRAQGTKEQQENWGRFGLAMAITEPSYRKQPFSKNWLTWRP